MKVFLDANVLISVLNKEYPLFTYTARILSLAGSKKFQVCTSPLCLAIAFYFAEKKYKSGAKDKIQLLCNHIEITNITASVVNQSLNDITVLDFEDGMEYYSALAAKCDCIITEDIQDFHFSKIEVLQSETFFDRYLVPGKN